MSSISKWIYCVTNKLITTQKKTKGDYIETATQQTNERAIKDHFSGKLFPYFSVLDAKNIYNIRKF